MKSRWDCLVYIDLFAGAGRALIRETKKIVPASPLVALDIPKPFSKYIFCELEPDKLSALKQRVQDSHPTTDVTFILGDCNERADDLLSCIPKPHRDFTVLTFCFVDPFKLANLRFATLERLAQNRRMDFLVLVPSGMDANRNEREYTQPDNHAVANFIGGEQWREEWPHKRYGFGEFVVDQFGLSMARNGYHYYGLAGLQLIRSTEKNLPLYHLGVFSKHELGARFWDECRKSTNPQRRLFG
jgi:three-Cys-motif partner protein